MCTYTSPGRPVADRIRDFRAALFFEIRSLGSEVEAVVDRRTLLLDDTAVLVDGERVPFRAFEANEEVGETGSRPSGRFRVFCPSLSAFGGEGFVSSWVEEAYFADFGVEKLARSMIDHAKWQRGKRP